ncbi:MAG: geranylgeranylglyceryl/heptaprenylglyceryl phosphate synthase [Candidatus Aenigmarchaeota archaeon]|nr:geranylgeranylglyceryl/heptaprenylglyceryl phosphate synthase [Candidatus Aenigmarchaeota archaeon]
MIFDELAEKGKSQKLHFTLIDPDKQPVEEAVKLAKFAKECGTDAFMIGGSSPTVVISLDETVKAIKEACKLPVILFPHSHAGISKHADAIFFMSLLNSADVNYVIEEPVKGAPLIKAYGIEPIPMGYLMFESGKTCTSQFVGRAKLLPNSKPEIATSYALAAQFLGMKLLYLEAGSGAENPVSNQVIEHVKRNVNIPVIVGGGIRDKSTALEKLNAGADIIVTGTINEGNREKLREIIGTIKKYR